MAIENRMALVDVLRKGEDPEAEVSAQIGAGRYERTDERATQRNGYRTRPWDTRVGTLELAIPKLRTGTSVPSWLEARKRGEQALISVVAEAYVQGVSTRKVEALVQSLGIAGISKSAVSRLVASLDAQATAFRTRRLDGDYPYIWVDARYEHVREDHPVQSMAVVIAYGVRADGVREVLGLDIRITGIAVCRHRGCPKVEDAPEKAVNDGPVAGRYLMVKGIARRSGHARSILGKDRHTIHVPSCVRTVGQGATQRYLAPAPAGSHLW